MTNHKQEIENAVKQFRKTVDRINTSDHPQYRDPLVKKYEIDAARAELDSRVAQLNNEFDAIMTQEVEKAEAAAKSSRFYVSETQKAQAQHALDEYVANVTLARDEMAKKLAGNRLNERLEDMDAPMLAHVRLQLPSVLSRVNGDTIALKRLQSINETLAQLKTPEQEKADELREQKRAGADLKHKHLKMTHPAYSQLRDNMHNGNFGV